MATMITKGQKVKFIPLKDIRVFGLGADNVEVIGVVTYINPKHRWFLAEYDGKGCKLRKGFKFTDIGQSVRVCDDNGNTVGYISEGPGSKPGVIHDSKIDRQMSMAEYLGEKLKIMRELGVTPTTKEWNRLLTLDSEIAIDNAVKTILKSRWAKRSYK